MRDMNVIQNKKFVNQNYSALDIYFINDLFVFIGDSGKFLCVCVCSGGGRGGDINPELILSFIFFL